MVVYFVDALVNYQLWRARAVASNVDNQKIWHAPVENRF